MEFFLIVVFGSAAGIIRLFGTWLLPGQPSARISRKLATHHLAHSSSCSPCASGKSVVLFTFLSFFVVLLSLKYFDFLQENVGGTTYFYSTNAEGLNVGAALGNANSLGELLKVIGFFRLTQLWLVKHLSTYCLYRLFVYL